MSYVVTLFLNCFTYLRVQLDYITSHRIDGYFVRKRICVYLKGRERERRREPVFFHPVVHYSNCCNHRVGASVRSLEHLAGLPMGAGA